MRSQKTGSFPECRQRAQPHIGLVLSSFPDCWKQRLFLLSCTGIFTFCGMKALIYTTHPVYYFLKKKLCVCMCLHAHATFSQKEVFNSFSLLLPSPTLSPGMREGKTAGNLEFSCWERDIFCNQVSVQRTNALRKLPKGEKQFRVIKLFSNVVWAAADLCEGNRMLPPRGSG